MEANVAQCIYLLSSAEQIFFGLEDVHLALEPQPGTKTAGWLVGHLAVTGDFARRLCGRSPLCPIEWRSHFNPGTRPAFQRVEYPPMAELCDAVRTVYADLCGAAVTVDPTMLAAENGYAPTRTAFPRAGDFVAYLLSPHLAYHLGQLVAWRAAAGLAISSTVHDARRTIS